MSSTIKSEIPNEDVLDAHLIGSGGNPECKLQPPKTQETNQLVYLRIVLFNEVWKRNGSELFRDPLDPDEWKLADYFDVIKQPMHLSLIREKLWQKKYLDAMDCIQDFDLMFSNWYTYFKDTDERISVAEALEKYFWERLSHMPEKEEECDSTPIDKRTQKHASERTATVTIPYQGTLNKDPKSIAENGNKSVSTDRHRKGRATNQLDFLRNHVLNVMWKHHCATPFREPVDPAKLNLPVDFDVVKHPIDLSSIKVKLDTNQYFSAKECLDDFTNLFSNCYKFYKSTGDEVIMAKILEKTYLTMIRDMPWPEVEVDLTRAHESERKLVVESSEAVATSTQETQLQSSSSAASNGEVVTEIEITSNDEAEMVMESSDKVITSEAQECSPDTPSRSSQAGTTVPVPVVYAPSSPHNSKAVASSTLIRSISKGKRKRSKRKHSKPCNIKQLTYLREFVLNTLWNHPFTESFRKAAVGVELPEYFDASFIEREVDFPLIKLKLESGEYRSFKQCKQDFDCMFSHICSYYKRNNQMLKKAELLKSIFDLQIRLMPPPEMTGDDGEPRLVNQSLAVGSNHDNQQSDNCNVTNQLVYIRDVVLSEMWKHDCATPFREPVNPAKRNVPHYCDIIKHPMDLSSIKEKLETNQYFSASQCVEDFNLMISNCYKYFEANSYEYQMAQKLEEIFLEMASKIPLQKPVKHTSEPENKRRRVGDVTELSANEGRRPVAESLVLATTSNQASEIQGVSDVSHADHEHPASKGQPRKGRLTNKLYFLQRIVLNALWNRRHAWEFREPMDPDKLNLPGYFDIIKHPMSLSIIKKKLKRKEYYCAEECLTDLNLIFSNCYKYFKPTDIAFKMAKLLEKFFMELIKGMPVSERKIIRHNTKNISKKLASLAEVNTSIERARFWQVYDAVSGSVAPPLTSGTSTSIGNNSTSEQKPRKGRLTNQLVYIRKMGLNSVWNHYSAKPFHKPINPVELKLPNYFDVVKQPMDMSLIKMKLETNTYYCVSECLNDFRLMFSNFYNYFKPGDEMYLAAESTETLFQRRLTKMPWPEVEVDSSYKVSPCRASPLKCSMKPKPETSEPLRVEEWKHIFS